MTYENSIDAKVAELMKLQGRPEKPLPPPATQIDELRDIFKHYRDCPFKPGDIVTMRPNANGQFFGSQPSLVLEVSGGAEPTFWGDDVSPGTQVYGSRFDVRVATYVTRGACYCAFWVESWTLQPYEPKTDGE